MDEISPILSPAGGKVACTEVTGNFEARRIPGCTAAPDRKTRETSAPADATLAPPAGYRWIGWRGLGAGLVTGASDDDPSGIATYSQVGAQFGYALGWVLVFSYPLLAAIQEISARIGCITRRGIAGNIRDHRSASLLRWVVALLLVANVINLGADINAMGAALALVVGGSEHVYAVMFGLLCVILMVRLQYRAYVSVLKWLCLTLFAYVATALVVHVRWDEAIPGLLRPSLTLNAEYMTAIVAILGTTISPYLFFWQAQLEVEDGTGMAASRRLSAESGGALNELRRIRVDTLVGMGISILIALCVLIATAATLHLRGTVTIESSAQAAEALRPIAGDLAVAIFAVGIVGTGMLAVPALAGSAAYALAEAFDWTSGLNLHFGEAKAFYGTIAGSILIGLAMNFAGVDPVRALYWSAVINGLVAPPLMAVIISLACDPKVVADMILPRSLRIAGWAATGIMTLAAVGMFSSWLV